MENVFLKILNFAWILPFVPKLLKNIIEKLTLYINLEIQNENFEVLEQKMKLM